MELELINEAIEARDTIRRKIMKLQMELITLQNNETAINDIVKYNCPHVEVIKYIQRQFDRSYTSITCAHCENDTNLMHDSRKVIKVVYQ